MPMCTCGSQSRPLRESCPVAGRYSHLSCGALGSLLLLPTALPRCTPTPSPPHTHNYPLAWDALAAMSTASLSSPAGCSTNHTLDLDGFPWLPPCYTP